MTFIALKLIGVALYTGIVFLVGKYWYTVNSVSDIEALYTKAVADLESIKTAVKTKAEAAQADADKLKALV